jgi:hypothetical protein
MPYIMIPFQVHELAISSMSHTGAVELPAMLVTCISAKVPLEGGPTAPIDEKMHSSATHVRRMREICT